MHCKCLKFIKSSVIQNSDLCYFTEKVKHVEENTSRGICIKKFCYCYQLWLKPPPTFQTVNNNET